MVSVFCILCGAKFNAKPKSYLNIKEYVPICWNCRNKPPPNSFRCNGKTKKGERCTKWVRPTQSYCKVHKGENK